MVLYSILADFSPTSYCLPKPRPILVWFDGTIIDIITMYYNGYVGLWLAAVHGDYISVQYNGGFLKVQVRSDFS